MRTEPGTFYQSIAFPIIITSGTKQCQRHTANDRRHNPIQNIDLLVSSKVEISVPWVEPNKSIRGELYYLLHLLFIHSKVRCGSESKIRVFVAI